MIKGISTYPVFRYIRWQMKANEIKDSYGLLKWQRD